MFVVGARPQFIKLAAIWPHRNDQHDNLIVHTGQHYDANLSKNFFEEFQIPSPDFHLGIGSGSHSQQIGLTSIALEELLVQEKPDMVVLFGDTNSTLAGALMADRLHIPIAHVEAGLRSFSRIPEETNRVLTDRLSELLFVPCRRAIDNLHAEGITQGIHLVGDVMMDIAQRIVDEPGETVLPEIESPFCLLTVHRAHNTDHSENLQNIIAALIESDRNVLFPCHPRTLKALNEHRLLSRIQTSKIKIVEPMSYHQVHLALRSSECVLTDSGGLQKEAYFHAKPCLTLRETTEWPETIDAGFNRLVGANRLEILKGLSELKTPISHPPIYGTGDASKQIIEILTATLK